MELGYLSNLQVLLKGAKTLYKEETKQLGLDDFYSQIPKRPTHNSTAGK